MQVCPWWNYVDDTLYHAYGDSYPDWVDQFWYDVYYGPFACS